jgi:hypothetical protein
VNTCACILYPKERVEGSSKIQSLVKYKFSPYQTSPQLLFLAKALGDCPACFSSPKPGPAWLSDESVSWSSLQHQCYQLSEYLSVWIIPRRLGTSTEWQTSFHFMGLIFSFVNCSLSLNLFFYFSLSAICFLQCIQQSSLHLAFFFSSAFYMMTKISSQE